MKFCPSPKCNRILVHNNNLLDSNSDSDSDTLLEAERSISSGTVAPSGQSVLVDTPVVPCDCATKWCFQCDSKAHWPASCQAAKEYDGFYAKEVGTLLDEKGDLFKMTVSFVF